jgi:hypothetical protein
LMIRFDQVGMRAIVDGVSRDHEADRGHVQAGRVIGVADKFGNGRTCRG